MTVFADSSAVVKLYVDEEGSEAIQELSSLAVGQLTRVEVPAAFWRKHRLGELDAVDARVLISAFEADYYGTADDQPRFVTVAATAGILDDAAMLCARYPLRSFDAVHLATALALRAVDPGLTTMAVYDRRLRAAAAAEGLAVLPSAPSPAGRRGGR